MTRNWPSPVKPKNRISAADPMAESGLPMADLVVIDPAEGAETAEFDLLDVGVGCPLLSVSAHFA